MAKTTHTVVWGDTLSEIALKYYKNFGYSSYTVYQKYLESLNGIKNPDYIVVGQVIRLTGSNSTTTNQGTSVIATIQTFGLQTKTDRTMYATWKWNRKNTKHYQVKWTYDTGDGVWFIGNDSTTTDKQSIYNAPANAKRVRLQVKPISTTYKKNNRDTNYWTAGWSAAKVYSFSSNPPSTPPVPTVTTDGYMLRAELSNLVLNATHIQFRVYSGELGKTRVFNTGTAKISNGSAAYNCAISPGEQYAVQCRAVRGDVYSDWSNMSAQVWSIPATPPAITRCQASSETSVFLSWNAVKSATSYDIEYTTEKTYFDGSDQTTVISSIETTQYEKTGLASGDEYFFRVRAVNSKGHSGWSEITSISIGKAPAAPTTWSSTTTAISGDPLTLYWVHNSKDESTQSFAEIEVDVDGTRHFYEIDDSAITDEEDKTYSYELSTSGYVEGAKIKWRVRTKGATAEYSDWSIQRTIDVYAPPTLVLDVTNVDNEVLETLETFPIYISATPGPATQSPIGYYVTVTANSAYETVDAVGNPKLVNAGEEVYAKHFDIYESLMCMLSAESIDLENNITYTIKCSVTMNSGLTAEASHSFTVSWIENVFSPNAEISIDENTYSAYIGPYCNCHSLTYYKVTYDAETDIYTRTEEVITAVKGEPVEAGYTYTGEEVYSTAEGVLYCVVESEETYLSNDILLSVYRREYNGALTEIAKNIENNGYTYVTDPHPALDYARYRIVATSKSTGAVGYYDLPGYPTGCKAVIIQWDEEWKSFESTEETALEQPSWAGSMLKLPYNIDVSNKNKSDVELIEYIGRKHPVSYYGTQLGETATWNVSVEKSDKETLYTLRRLSAWMGNVYVREPSGSGYWANITVSFSQKHCDLIIPVAIEIAHVEGGI